MARDLPGEIWKEVQFDFEFTNQFKLEVSNKGRLRTFHKLADGNIIKGSMTEGYRIVRLKLYRPREESMQQRLDHLQQQVFKLAKKIRDLKKESAPKKEITEAEALLDMLKTNLSKKYKQDLKSRTINYHALIHRLVAEYFLKQPSAQHTIVAHLDHEKLNNNHTNLKWMTPEENYEHQKGSPHVKLDKQQRRQRQQENPNRAKLTVTRVMLLKKLLNEGKPMKQLIKQFKITDTQILRIKRGENWPNVPPAV